MERECRNRAVFVALAGATLMLAGCASKQPAEQRQSDQIARASQRISEAERASGAYQYAGDSLNLARDKLRAAQRAADEKDEEKAQWLAEEAALDADLAVATASNQEQQTALNEVQESIQTLREELQRNAQPSSSDLQNQQGRPQ
jgi:seryl-tRNA synthetase